MGLSRMKIALQLRWPLFRLNHKRSPLARDPVWSALDAAERRDRKAHKPVRHLQASKTERLHQLIRRPDAAPISRATILNILGA